MVRLYLFLEILLCETLSCHIITIFFRGVGVGVGKETSGMEESFSNEHLCVHLVIYAPNIYSDE